MQRTATVHSKRMLSPSVVELSLSVAGPPLAFEAGQWINLHVETESGRHKRAYSIASAPGDAAIELAVTRVSGGCVSPTLHALEEGAAIGFDGPHGLFTRDTASQARSSLFVATGTGLSPFRSMLRDTLGRGSKAPICVLFGARTEADMLWRDELTGFSQTALLCRYEVTLSRPDAAWQGRRGYVQAHLAELVRELAPSDVYICGLNKMVAEVRALLKGELGFDRRQIHSERYD